MVKSVRPAGDRAVALMEASGLSAAYTPIEPEPRRSANAGMQKAELVPIAALSGTWFCNTACQMATPSSR